jgi:1-acyl-sn-glycerol-3-phosphate acyltransferase
LAKGILKPWLASWFRWHLEGLENIPPRGEAGILAFNHIAYLDALAAAYAVDKARRVPRFLAKRELFEDKRIAWILKGAKQIEVRRGSRDAPMALDNALRALDDGELIVVFPEGTITTDPQLHPKEAKTGAARLSMKSGVPITPAGIWGTANIWPKGYAKRWTPGQDILIRIGSAIAPEGDPESRDEWQDLGRAVMDEIARLTAGLRPAVPDRRRPKKRAA